MAITEAEVLSVVNDRLNRAEADISEELRWALYDISTKDNFLSDKYTFDTTDGTATYDWPTSFKEIKALRIQTGSTWTDPLEKLNFREYLKYASGDDSTGEPDSYTLYKSADNAGKFYLYPTPGDSYTAEVWYSKYHSNSTDTIEYPERFREAVYQGTLFKVAEKYELTEAIDKHFKLYQGEIIKLSDNLSQRQHPVIVDYVDL